MVRVAGFAVEDHQFGVLSLNACDKRLKVLLPPVGTVSPPNVLLGLRMSLRVRDLGRVSSTPRAWAL